MSSIDVFGVVAEIIDTLINWAGGWRYVFSPSFRRSVHERWRGQRRMRMVTEVIACSAGFVLFNSLIALALLAMIRGC